MQPVVCCSSSAGGRYWSIAGNRRRRLPAIDLPPAPERSRGQRHAVIRGTRVDANLSERCVVCGVEVYISVPFPPVPTPSHPSPPTPVHFVIHSYLSPYRTSFFPFSLISVNAVSHCPICHSLKFYLQHVGLLQLTSVGTSFLQQDLNTVLQLSTTYLTATWDISQGNLPSILILAPEFLSSAGFLKRTRGVPAKTNSIPADLHSSHFHPRGIPATPIPTPAKYPRNPLDSRHP